MKIYLIPGLGYDDRIFERLNFGNLDVSRINWIEPNVDETIHDYSKRLFEDIVDNGEKVILIGHSLGGVISQEIATVKKIHKIILISSLKSSKEIPLLFRFVKWLRLHHFFTKEWSIKTVAYWGKNHGFENEEEQNLFKSMVGQHTNFYLQWALKSLSNWNSPKIPSTTEVFQIHGTNDKTLPFKYIDQPNITIESGTHIMVYKKASEINDILQDILRKDSLIL